MTITELLRQEISKEFQRQGKAGLIVWYDRGGTLTSVVEKATPDDAQIVRFQGGYLALRFELENQDPNFDRRWLIHVPESPPKDSWLRDLELLGVRWEMDLLELLHRKADLSITPRLSDLLRDHPQNSRDLVQEWESLFAARGVTEPSLVDGLLALCFGLSDWHIEQGMLSFLGGRVRREQLQTRGLWEVFKERTREATGWTEIPDDDNVLRQRLEAAILLSELVGALPELAARFAGVLPSQSARSAFGQGARNWRDREDLRDCYLKAAKRIEREYELDAALTLSERLLSVETFPIIDELWQREATNAVAPDGGNFGEKTARIGAIAEQRSKLFWARKGKALFWEQVALAANPTSAPDWDFEIFFGGVLGMKQGYSGCFRGDFRVIFSLFSCFFCSGGRCSGERGDFFS